MNRKINNISNNAVVARKLLPTLCLSLVLSNLAAQESAGKPGRNRGKPNPLKNVYFGEQHLHTSASPDAFAVETRGTWA